MIVRIIGQLCDVTEETAVIERDGVAREIMIPGYAVAELGAAKGQGMTLHTMQYLEGSAAGGNMTPRMIGFLHTEDRAFFTRFITVKGLGVKKGLRALAAPVARIASFIESGDTKALCGLPGIGKRMAEQIVAQLRGKVGSHAYADDADVPEAAKHEFTADQRDAIEIIVAWGDGRDDAQRWIARAAQLHADVSGPEQWVKVAYRIKSGSEA